MKLSTAFYTQIDRQAVRTIQTLENILRVCMFEFKGIWDDQLLLIEFSYNNIYHSSMRMTSFKALYGTRCSAPLGCFTVGDSSIFGPDIILEELEKVRVIMEKLVTSYSRQK